jgi:hypothetical protein
LKGYIYVIGPSREEGRVKVGISKNHPLKRLKQLQTGSPYPLRLYGYRKAVNYAEVEAEAHRRLAGVSSHLEWFQTTPEVALRAIDASLRPSALVEGYWAVRGLWEAAKAAALGAFLAFVVSAIVGALLLLGGML